MTGVDIILYEGEAGAGDIALRTVSVAVVAQDGDIYLYQVEADDTDIVLRNGLVVAGTAYQESVSENVTTDEALVVIADLVVGLNESLTTGESLSVIAGLIVPLDETATTSDALVVFAGRVATLAETVTAGGETIETLAGFKPSIAETVGATDALATLAAFQSSLSETVLTSEARSIVFTAVVALAENVITAEAVVGVVGRVVAVNETVTTANAVATLVAFKPDLIETVVVTEARSIVYATAVSLIDSVSTAESLASIAGLYSSVSETVLLSESVFASRGFVLGLAESTGAVGESAVAATGWVVGTAETVSVVESTAIVAGLHTVVGETVGITEAMNGGLFFEVQLAESSGALGESVTVSLARIALLAESVVVVESLASAAGLHSAVDDIQFYTEALVGALSTSVGLVESVALAETRGTECAFLVQIVESAAFAEFISEGGGQYSASVAETVAISESLSVSRGQSCLVVETVTVSGQVQSNLVQIASLVEDVPWIGVCGVFQAGALSLSEEVSITEAVLSRIPGLTVSFSPPGPGTNSGSGFRLGQIGRLRVRFTSST